MTRPRRALGFGLVALVILFLAIKLVSPPAGRGGRPAHGFVDAPFGPFAGYAWEGPVKSVGASFTVPRIASGSPLSQAGTWIGAQGQGPPPRFVQIGEIESRFWSSKEQKTVDLYYTFWSDTAHHFKAQPLFPVKPGDSLAASLTLAGREWKLAITDNSSHKNARFSVAEQAQAPFTQAEWTQEDPGNPNNHVRYPQMAAPVFEHLTFNSSEPAPAEATLYSQWMSVNGSNLAPTALHDDSFTLQRAPAVSAAGEQYVRLAATGLDAYQRFETERSSWTPKTPYADIVNASLKLIEATRQSTRAARSLRWPKQISGLVRSANEADAAFVERARPPTLLTAASFAAWNSALTQAAERAGKVGSRLRVALGLPGLGFAVQPTHR
jgi:hypothetical protein